MSKTRSSSELLALIGLVVVVATVCLLNHAGRVSCGLLEGNNNGARDEPETISVFPEGQECPEGEKLKPGVLPIDEPTCENPRPVQKKIFSYSIDYVPCFCNEPMVRNKQTGKCVELADCPDKQ